MVGITNWNIPLNLRCDKWQLFVSMFLLWKCFLSLSFLVIYVISWHVCGIVSTYHYFKLSCHIPQDYRCHVKSSQSRAKQSLFFIIKGSCYSAQIETSIYCRRVPGYWKQLLLKLVHQMLIFFFLLKVLTCVISTQTEDILFKETKWRGFKYPESVSWLFKQTKITFKVCVRRQYF